MFDQLRFFIVNTTLNLTCMVLFFADMTDPREVGPEPFWQYHRQIFLMVSLLQYDHIFQI